MARFSGVVGFGQIRETKPGVWEEDIIEKPYYGEVKRNSRQFREGEQLNNDLSVGNSIEIVADAYASDHFFAIRYVKWAGGYWTVPDVTVQAPRLLLRLGGVYNGPRAATTSSHAEGDAPNPA